MSLNKEEQEEYKNAKFCHLCFNNFNDKLNDKGVAKFIKVRDHDHLNGRYRGAAHQDCNLNANLKNYKFPVIAHNSKNYDNISYFKN